MSLRIRALVFSTFFGSCIAIGLLLVSLTTNSWVRATPKKRNSTVSLFVVIAIIVIVERNVERKKSNKQNKLRR